MLQESGVPFRSVEGALTDRERGSSLTQFGLQSNFSERVLVTHVVDIGKADCDRDLLTFAMAVVK